MCLLPRGNRLCSQPKAALDIELENPGVHNNAASPRFLGCSRSPLRALPLCACVCACVCTCVGAGQWRPRCLNAKALSERWTAQWVLLNVVAITAEPDACLTRWLAKRLCVFPGPRVATPITILSNSQALERRYCCDPMRSWGGCRAKT